MENNSGMGKNITVPENVLGKFNWGAFLLTWIWGLKHKSFITLIIFPVAIFSGIPVIGFLLSLGVLIWFGINGNKWAWQNNQFESVEKFHELQKKWAVAGLVVFCIFSVLIFTLLQTLTAMK